MHIFSENVRKVLKNPSYLFKYREIRRLYGIPRFTNTTSDLIGFPLKIVDSASFVYMYKEIFEREIYKFKSMNNPRIIDCGANIGLSVVYFKKLYPNAQIIAFEPDPKVFEVLNENIKSLGFSDIELIPKAVWSENGCLLSFFSEGGDGGRIVFNSKSYAKIVKVETLRLRDLLSSKVDFLKIDIEGAESEVLLDCDGLLSNVKNLFVEYHASKDNKYSLGDVLVLLDNSGFRYYIEHIDSRYQRPFIEINTSSDVSFQLNIFAFRS